MNKYTFGILCELLCTVGRVKADGYVTLEEQVAIFLHILAHYTKKHFIIKDFYRSGETISRYFNNILNGVLRLQELLLRVPDPIPHNCIEERWRWFKNCLGALDGNYIRMHVPEIDKPRYRTRKGEVATNVLGVGSRDLRFIYVLPGWEGFGSYAWILRDAISRRNGLKVPTGYYYLVDAGCTNSEEFLRPYQRTRYHLKEWGNGNLSRSPEEYFSMKHSTARNIIERAFGLLKMRWAILRSPSFYPVKTQVRIIMTCCLLHNLIKTEMSLDPAKNDLDNGESSDNDGSSIMLNASSDIISTVEGSGEWVAWRDNLAINMFNEWRARRGSN